MFSTHPSLTSVPRNLVRDHESGNDQNERDDVTASCGVENTALLAFRRTNPLEVSSCAGDHHRVNDAEVAGDHTHEAENSVKG